MSLQVQDLSYILPGGDVLFSGINFSVQDGEKCAIIGDNGVGKSTLLRIIAGRLQPADGSVRAGAAYLVPQHFGQFDTMTVAEALGMKPKLDALHSILSGQADEQAFAILGDDWNLEEEIAEAFKRWGIAHISPETPMGRLSGGEKTKVFLAGIDLCKPDLVLMDEPTNHLDTEARERLSRYVEQSRQTILLVSHDRRLLNLMPQLYEMSADGLRYYPMNYEAYHELSEAERASMSRQLESKQKEMAKMRKSARETMERQQKHNARGERRSEGKGLARIVMGGLSDKAEATTARLGRQQEEKLQAMSREVSELRQALPAEAAMKITIDEKRLHPGKRQVELRNVGFAYPDCEPLWQGRPLSLLIAAGDRLRICGGNGSGKSTLLKLIMGELNPTSGELWRAEGLSVVCLDQEYSLIDNSLTVYGQMERSCEGRPEHELKMLLSRFLFPAETWDKLCGVLSGGEKMRLALCGQLARESAPDIIIADEPTNNLDIRNIDILASALHHYNGTLILVSHDEEFVEEVGVRRSLTPPSPTGEGAQSGR